MKFVCKCSQNGFAFNQFQCLPNVVITKKKTYPIVITVVVVAVLGQESHTERISYGATTLN